MSETVIHRLSKVAKELNVSIGTITDFLKSKGHAIESNPNAKISGELYTLLLDGFGGKVVLWWGLRFIRGLYWQKWLQEIKEKYKNFDFEIYMSQPDSMWTGKQGHVGDNLDADGIKGRVLNL